MTKTRNISRLNQVSGEILRDLRRTNSLFPSLAGLSISTEERQRRLLEQAQYMPTPEEWPAMRAELEKGMSELAVTGITAVRIRFDAERQAMAMDRVFPYPRRCLCCGGLEHEIDH